jgi:hypothetical protein
LFSLADAYNVMKNQPSTGASTPKGIKAALIAFRFPVIKHGVAAAASHIF